MAVTLTTLVQPGNKFAINAFSADWSGGETILAAQGAGKTIYIHELIINAVAATTFTLRDGTTTLIGPIEFVATGDSLVHITFADPIHGTANTALTGVAAAANVTAIVIGEVL